MGKDFLDKQYIVTSNFAYSTFFVMIKYGNLLWMTNPQNQSEKSASKAVYQCAGFGPGAGDELLRLRGGSFLPPPLRSGQLLLLQGLLQEGDW